MGAFDTAASTTLTHEQTTAALAASDGRVLRWWQVTAFLDVAGPDAATLLDGLCTQAVERIEPRTARLGLFLDAKAKIIAPAVLHRLPDAPWTDPRTAEPVDAQPRFVLETLPELVEPLRSHLARYRLRAKATIEPVDLSTVALIGDDAAEPVTPVDDASAWIDVQQPGRSTRSLVGSAAACADATSTYEALAANPDALEADRIAARHASLHDLLPGRMPAEVGGMDAAVALDAGCYLGQEPVARLHYRGRANRTLRLLEATDGTPLAPGAGDPAQSLALHSEDDDARVLGRITTWATGADGRVTALAMLRREVESGALLRIASPGPAMRVIGDPPA